MFSTKKGQYAKDGTLGLFSASETLQNTAPHPGNNRVNSTYVAPLPPQMFYSIPSRPHNNEDRVADEIAQLRTQLAVQFTVDLLQHAAINRARRARELTTQRPPYRGEIREYVQSCQDLPPIQNILNFYQVHKSQHQAERVGEFGTFADIAKHGEHAFWNPLLHNASSEQRSRDYIRFVKESLEQMVLDSDTLHPRDKRLFLNTLNTHDRRQFWRTAGIIFGLLAFTIVAPICLTFALEFKATECMATALLCATLTFGPYWLISKFMPSSRYFPLDKGAICEVTPFIRWLNALNQIVATISPHCVDAHIPIAEAVPPAACAAEQQRAYVVPPPPPSAPLANPECKISW